TLSFLFIHSRSVINVQKAKNIKKKKKQKRERLNPPFLLKTTSRTPSTPNPFSDEANKPSHRPFLLTFTAVTDFNLSASTSSTTAPLGERFGRRRVKLGALGRLGFGAPLVSLILSGEFRGVGERVFEGVDDFVDELVVRRGVPAHPVAHVAAKAGTVKEGRMIAVHDHLRVPSVVIVVVGRGGGGAREEISENFSVLRREGESEGEDGGGEEGEVVGDGWRRRRGRGGGVDGSFTVELLHRLKKRERERREQKFEV
ncbi:hypothetical protein V8G54_016288, partial [Vigna mungo]